MMSFEYSTEEYRKKGKEGFLYIGHGSVDPF